MSTSPRQILISFDVASQQYAARWQAIGQDILQRATDEMQQEGVAATIDRQPSGSVHGERALDWGDFVLNVAGNAAAALLLKAISEFVHWIRRETSHSDLPSCIELQAGKAIFRIERNAVPEAVYKELTVWVPQALAEGQITIHFET